MARSSYHGVCEAIPARPRRLPRRDRSDRTSPVDPTGRERAEVEEANARFYRVFETLDLQQMDEIWAHEDHVRCVHPGWCMLAGWEAVRHSWEVIFKNSQEMRFSITDVHAHVEGAFGWVTCTENILSEIPRQHLGDVGAGHQHLRAERRASGS